MPQGLQIFNAAGALQLEITDRITRILGNTGPVTGSGSVTDSGFSTGTAWWTVVPVASIDPLQDSFNVSVAGNVLSWSGGVPGREYIILYGVY